MHWILGEPTDFIDQAGMTNDAIFRREGDHVPTIETSPVDPALLNYILSELQGQGSVNPVLNHRGETITASRARSPAAGNGTEYLRTGSPRRGLQSRADSLGPDATAEDRWREWELGTSRKRIRET